MFATVTPTEPHYRGRFPGQMLSGSFTQMVSQLVLYFEAHAFSKFRELNYINGTQAFDDFFFLSQLIK